MILSISNLSKKYQNHVALNNITIDIPQGIIFGLLGPNGAGKTSLIRILTQITEADSGKILLNGIPLEPKHIRAMGYLPEERGLYKKMQVADQLLYLAELKGLSKQEAKSRLKYWVDKFEIKSWLNKKVEELSKGMQQKIQFIGTVLHEPEIIILDEPFSGFDPINAQLLIDEILLLKEKGTTIIFSTHRMDSVELLCDQIALINLAEKILDGNVPDLKKQFKKNQFELSYIGQINLENLPLEMVSVVQKNNLNTALIKAKEPMSNKQIIQLLLNTDINLISFAEKLPSMEEIFIEAVQQKNN
ncbi:MAG: ABC transporter ATP-binding protein [Bacteroidetes bacterium]|jgi:ABC-2 type transport system ATP-binding protein|nr:ABC transporter ATP-binding protein [Bacteroidota bacterium]